MSLFDVPFEDEGSADTGPPRERQRRIYSVTEITCEVRQRLEDQFVDVWVEGELSNCRLWQTGHYYFTLKDAGAQLKGVLFKSAARYLRFKPADGQHVIARGRLTVYEPKGEYQLVCELMEPRGHGALQLAFEELKRRLQAEGLFDEARKRRLPTLPRRIGVVTSLDGAAVRDIVKVLALRHFGARILIRPARVQGEGAAADVAHAIRQIGRAPDVDVIIVARGGGSFEDMAAFNDERVARAIVASPVPVVTGIGHQVDFTIADFVADHRASTPSNAAEIVVARTDEFHERITQLERRLRFQVTLGVRERRARVQRLDARPALAGLPGRLALRGRHVAELTHTLRTAVARTRSARALDLHGLRLRLEAADPQRRLARLRGALQTLDARLGHAGSRRAGDARTTLRALAGRLESLSPLAVLGRGYAVCWNADRTRALRSSRETREGALVHVTLARGALSCEIKSTFDA